jgi:hypothetical protein
MREMIDEIIRLEEDSSSDEEVKKNSNSAKQQIFR